MNDPEEDFVDGEPDTRAEIRAAADAERARLTLYIFTAAFWSYALERVIKTFGQSFAAAAFAGGVAVGLHQIDWALSLSIGGGAALLSLITSLVNYSRPPAPTSGNPDA